MSIEIKEAMVGREMNMIAVDTVLTRLQENGNLFCFGSKKACENIAKRYADKESNIYKSEYLDIYIIEIFKFRQ